MKVHLKQKCVKEVYMDKRKVTESKVIKQISIYLFLFLDVEFSKLLYSLVLFIDLGQPSFEENIVT